MLLKKENEKSECENKEHTFNFNKLKMMSKLDVVTFRKIKMRIFVYIFT